MWFSAVSLPDQKLERMSLKGKEGKLVWNNMCITCKSAWIIMLFSWIRREVILKSLLKIRNQHNTLVQFLIKLKTDISWQDLNQHEVPVFITACRAASWSTCLLIQPSFSQFYCQICHDVQCDPSLSLPYPDIASVLFLRWYLS